MLMERIIDGSQAITISVNAADLRNVVVEIVNQERERIRMAVEADKERPTLSRAEAAKMIGVHPNTLDRWAADGYLTPTKIGSRVLYRMSDIDEILSRNTKKI